MVARAILYHAGVANEYPPEKINTSDFQLYTLNTAKISVEDLLAKSFAERSTILADNSYWTLVADVSGNTSNITTHDFETENARIFKLNVSKTDTTGWPLVFGFTNWSCMPIRRAPYLVWRLR